MDPVPVTRLERDWRRELAGHVLADHLHDWRRREPVLRPFKCPAALLAWLRRSRPGAREDAVLLALLRCARGDPLAARFVLQAMMPALKRLSAGVPVDADEQAELWSTLLRCAWECIRGYPLQRRPRRVAANIRLDVLHDVVRAHRLGTVERRRAAPCPPALLPAVSVLRAAGDVDGLLSRAVRAGAVSAGEAELVAATRIDGRSLVSLATHMGVPYDALRMRRARAERRLLLHLGVRDVRFPGSKRLLDGARVAGAGPAGQAGANNTTPQGGEHPGP